MFCNSKSILNSSIAACCVLVKHVETSVNWQHAGQALVQYCCRAPALSRRATGAVATIGQLLLLLTYCYCCCYCCCCQITVQITLPLSTFSAGHDEVDGIYPLEAEEDADAVGLVQGHLRLAVRLLKSAAV
jgi:hypothetical protein